MATWNFYNNFTAGEWTPKLDARSDLGKYDSACRSLQNMRVMPYGGARYRSGFELVAPTLLPERESRLIPFQYSTELRYMVELGHEYICVYSNDGKRLDISDIDWESEEYRDVPEWERQAYYYIDSPYTEEQIFSIQYKQVNDVIYLVHPDVPPHKLLHYDAKKWEMEEIEWTWAPMMDENITETTLQLSATQGEGVTLSASDDLFDPLLHEGAYFEIRHLKEAESIYVPMHLTTRGEEAESDSAILIQGDWTATTTERWYGTLEIQRTSDTSIMSASDEDGPWETVRKFEGASDRNVSASGTQPTLARFRLKYTSRGDPYGSEVWSGNDRPGTYVRSRGTLECADAYVAALVKVTEVRGPREAIVDVLQPAGDTKPTDIWSEGAWSAFRGYPRAIGMYEQRLMIGGTKTQPNTLWGSVTDDFENFRYGEDDDAAIAYTFAATEQNYIQWIDSMQRILAATSAREFTISAGNTDEPLTPSNIVVRAQSSNGSAHLQGVPVSDAVIALDRQQKKINEIAYAMEKDGYALTDLTIFAEHITDSGVRQMAFAKQPDPMLLVTLNNGQLAVLTYDRQQDVVAWSKWVTRGAFESVVSVAGSPEDEIWAVVRREVDGGEMRFIEKLTLESEDPETGCWLDGAIIFDTRGENPEPEEEGHTIVGVEELPAYLVGDSISVLVDGRVFSDLLVVPDPDKEGYGMVDFEREVPNARRVIIGYPYRGILQPMKMDVVLANGPSQGRKRRISELTLRFRNTIGCKYGPDLENLDEVVFREANSVMDTHPKLFTGDKREYWNDGHDKSGSIVVVQDTPLPFTLLGMAVRWEVFGD